MELDAEFYRQQHNINQSSNHRNNPQPRRTNLQLQVQTLQEAILATTTNNTNSYQSSRNQHNSHPGIALRTRQRMTTSGVGPHSERNATLSREFQRRISNVEVQVDTYRNYIINDDQEIPSTNISAFLDDQQPTMNGSQPRSVMIANYRRNRNGDGNEVGEIERPLHSDSLGVGSGKFVTKDGEFSLRNNILREGEILLR